MFPNSTDINLNNETKSSSGVKSYLFDFDSGDFVVRDGKLVDCDGIDAIKGWIEKILRTENGRYSIYADTEYGCHLEDLIIGNSYTVEFIEAELKRVIGDTEFCEIRIPCHNTINIVQNDGTVITKHWENPSRRESWTPQMREMARERSKNG